MLNLKEYRTMFVSVSLILIILAALPAFGAVVSFPSSAERFSELWVLDPSHKTENYPFNVRSEEQLHLFLGVRNHMGRSQWYVVYVKFRNQTQPLPDVSNSKPSPLPPLYEFNLFLKDGEAWEMPLNFTILGASVHQDSMVIDNISINNAVFSVDRFSKWDTKYNGFYFQLFFELWMYNITSEGFQYHDRFVGIWLNMTK